MHYLRSSSITDCCCCSLSPIIFICITVLFIAVTGLGIRKFSAKFRHIDVTFIWDKAHTAFIVTISDPLFFSFFIGLGCNPIQSATARHYYFDPCMFQSAGFIFPALPMLIRVRACTHATPPPHWACTQHAHAPPLADRRLRS